MKFQLHFSLVILLFALSCKDKSTHQEMAADKPRVLMMEILLTSDECNPDSASCTYAKIVYPSFTDSTTWILNDFLLEKIMQIGGDYTQDSLAKSIDDLAQTFIYDFERFQKDFPDYNFGWYLKINSEVILDDSAFVSFRIDSEAYTGGAHPNSTLSYYIVNTSTGKALEVQDIIADTLAFKNALEKAFRDEKGLDESQSLADLGYFIEEDGFMLTNNIGMTGEDIMVHFNPYEIAPYSLGPTTITLSRSSLGSIMKLR